MTRRIVPILGAVVLLAGCGSKTDTTTEFKSMDQIQQERGVPVVVREIKPETFYEQLKYPATFRARSESTASAGLSDVVRTVLVGVGDKVSKDQIVLTFSQDHPSYLQAKANAENAEASFKRSTSLFETKGISQQAYDNARTQYEVAKASFKAMDDVINVKAPISGVVTRLNVQPTTNVKSGDALLTVSNLDILEAKIWVSASEITKVKTGQAASVEWLGRTLAGTVSQVSLVMDPDKKAFQVLAVFDNPNHLLTSGITADVTIRIYENAAAVTVERKEVVKDGGRYYAFVAKGDTAERRELAVRGEQGLTMEISSGLKAGDLLIAEGCTLVKQGTKIAIQKKSSVGKGR